MEHTIKYTYLDYEDRKVTGWRTVHAPNADEALSAFWRETQYSREIVRVTSVMGPE